MNKLFVLVVLFGAVAAKDYGSKCAREHASKGGNICKCNGVVHYGAKGKFASKSVKGQITCNNASFGDPIQGTVKDCFCKAASTELFFSTASMSGWKKSSHSDPSPRGRCTNMAWGKLSPPKDSTYTQTPKLASHGPYGVTPGTKGFLGTDGILWFKRSINLGNTKYTASIEVAVDNNVKVWLNGKAVGYSSLFSASEWIKPFLTWDIDASGKVTGKNNAKSSGKVHFQSGVNTFVFAMRNCGHGDRGALEVSVKVKPVKVVRKIETTTVTAKVGYWGSRHGHWRTSIKVNGANLVFHPGYKSGSMKGAARVDGKFGNQNMGWVPATNMYHTYEVTLRKSGVNTFKIIDGKNKKLTWSKNFTKKTDVANPVVSIEGKRMHIHKTTVFKDRYGRYHKAILMKIHKSGGKKAFCGPVCKKYRAHAARTHKLATFYKSEQHRIAKLANKASATSRTHKKTAGRYARSSSSHSRTARSHRSAQSSHSRSSRTHSSKYSSHRRSARNHRNRARHHSSKASHHLRTMSRFYGKAAKHARKASHYLRKYRHHSAHARHQRRLRSRYSKAAQYHHKQAKLAFKRYKSSVRHAKRHAAAAKKYYFRICHLFKSFLRKYGHYFRTFYTWDRAALSHEKHSARNWRSASRHMSHLKRSKRYRKQYQKLAARAFAKSRYHARQASAHHTHYRTHRRLASHNRRHGNTHRRHSRRHRASQRSHSRLASSHSRKAISHLRSRNYHNGKALYHRSKGNHHSRIASHYSKLSKRYHGHSTTYAKKAKSLNGQSAQNGKRSAEATKSSANYSKIAQEHYKHGRF